MDEHTLETFRRVLNLSKQIQDEINQILEGLPTVTQHIVSLERDETRNSGSPMWRCVTSAGDRVNIFQHSDPDKNNFTLFEAAGWAQVLESMPVGGQRNWTQNPIEVVMRKPGKFWEIIAVTPKPEGAAPDDGTLESILADDTDSSALDNLRDAMDDLPF